MKRAAILIPIAALAACGGIGPAHDAASRGDVVKICKDGTYVIADPQTKRLVIYRDDGMADVAGFVAAGVSADQVCQN